MATVVVVLLLALALAAAVIVYAAYPYRGEDTPVSPRLGRAMRRGVDAVPTVASAHLRGGDEAAALLPDAR